MRIRDAHIDDATSLAALSLEVWLGTYLRDGIENRFAEFALDMFQPDRMRKVLEDPKQSVLVAEGTAGLTGYVQISWAAPAPVGDSQVEIAHLYVRPGQHGQGIGQALMARAFETACDARSVWLIVNQENTRARAFYLEQGFIVAGEAGFEINGTSYPQDVMIRRL